MARARFSVRTKLLAGFLVVAFLLLGMAIIGGVFINGMSRQIEEITLIQEKTNHANNLEFLANQQMLALAGQFIQPVLTTSSLERETALFQGWFSAELDAIESISRPEEEELLRAIRESDAQFAVTSRSLTSLLEAGDIDEARAQYISQVASRTSAPDPPPGFALESSIQKLKLDAARQMTEATVAFDSESRVLKTLVWSFSGFSLGLALLLGFVMSSAFIRPVRLINAALARIADGDFAQRVNVPNRDEFGDLSQNVNKMSEQLSDLYEQLRSELAERERAEATLSARTAELAATNQELEAFSYSVSHDLRAPLRGIDGFSQALMNEYSDVLDEQALHYLQRVRTGSERMGQLIDDLLALSQVTRGEMRRENVDLSDLARTIVTGLQERDSQRQVEFVIQEGVVLNGDTRLLRVALENLRGNAWKYTGKHQKARIEFGSTEDDGKRTCFVRDDGSGFDMAYADRLFGAFQRLHDASEFEGSGIGLATVQRIINRHGGQIWAESAPEQGATFYFTLH